MRKIIVVPYNEKWKVEFEKIKQELLSVLGNDILGIEHVGSTSVEGLAAKPIIDLDIVIKDYNSFEKVKSNLAKIGYIHNGDQGIKERHAFNYTDKPHLMRHHLYVCPAYSEALRAHIAFRDYLRTNKEDREKYSEVKLLAAAQYPEDIDAYMEAKAPCIVEINDKCSQSTQGGLYAT